MSWRTAVIGAPHRVGRDPAKIEVTSLLPTSVGDTREAALAALRPGLAIYAGFFPRYNRMMAEHGYPVEAAAIAEAWARGDREAAERAVSDGLPRPFPNPTRRSTFRPSCPASRSTTSISADRITSRRAPQQGHDGMVASNVVAGARTVLFRRVRSVLIRSHGQGLIANTLNFDYEVRSADEAFSALPGIIGRRDARPRTPYHQEKGGAVRPHEVR